MSAGGFGRSAPRWPRLAVGLSLATPAAVLTALAVTDRHLAAGPTALVVSTVTGALAVGVLTVPPLLVLRARTHRLVRRRPGLAWHRALGLLALGLVLAHVGALYLLSPEDTRFALSPDGPTRGRMALLATVALLVVVLLGLLRERLPMARTTWRILHAFFATLVLALGLGHAVVTDGALDGAGTVVLLGMAAVAVAGVAATQLRRPRRGA